MKDVTEKGHDTGKQFLKESMLLSCTTVGRTVSSSYAEKSVTWEEQRLGVTKSKLDEKLYRSIVKLNSDRLQIVDELTKLKKSRSTGNLESMARPTFTRSKSARPRDTQPTRSPPSRGSKSRRNSTDVGLLSLPVKCSKCHHGFDASKKLDISSRTAFKLGADSCSDESSDDERENKLNSTLTRTISVVSCQLGRECRSARSELHKFENTSRRYMYQVFSKNKPNKT